MKRCLECGATSSTAHPRCTTCGHRPAEIDGFPCYAPELALASAGYDAGLFTTMVALEARSFWFRSRNELIGGVIERHAPGPASIMEVGCGTGFVLSALARRFPDAQLHGSEIFVEGLRHARQRVPAAHFAQVDARAIPFQEEFDVLCAFDVLEHIAEDTDVLEEMHRALRPGGLIVLTVPQHPWLWSPADEHAHHVRRYTTAELADKVKGAGFEVVRDTSFVTALLPLMLLTRLMSRLRGRTYDPSAELNLPRMLDRVLGGLMTLERSVIRVGCDLPFGGSRLVVGRRSMRDVID